MWKIAGAYKPMLIAISINDLSFWASIKYLMSLASLILDMVSDFYAIDI